MPIQYACFTSLVLHDVHGNCPIFPFDPSTGQVGYVGYHYSPSLTIKEIPDELGYAISHYEDQDSRRICCFEVSSQTATEKPDLLTDAVSQGLAAFGGKTLTPTEARDLARELQPARSFQWTEIDPDTGEEVTKEKTYGTINLDQDDMLEITVTVEDVE